MSSSAVDLLIQGIPLRRQKRLQAKKRKIEAFLNLVSGAELEVAVEAKKPKENGSTNVRSLEDDFRSLQNMKALLKKKQNEGEPGFYLTEHGIKAQVNFTFYNKDKPLGQTLAPLFVEDIQHLLLRGIIGGSSAVTTRWCKIVRDRNLSHIVLFVIDGLSKDTVVNNVSCFSNMLEIFPNMVEVLTPDSYSLNFATELCGVHLSLGHRSKLKEQDSDLGVCNSFRPLTTIFPIEEVNNPIPDKSYSKLHLLLSPIQLVMENFPLPKSVFEGSKSEGYCFTKNVYAHVTAESPLFALDCEMCRMRSGRMEVTRIALINEQFNVVYNTLVKPKGTVTDYLTKYSGVTQEMLASVKTTLSDVQNKIQSILPADAILCGQSLNFDLHALKMIHPYVIDTSVIYNTSGCRTKKAGLRILADKFLNETIQCSEKGHDPIEDCVATMKLVHLKLKNYPQFGDAILMGRNLFTNTSRATANVTKKSCSSDSSQPVDTKSGGKVQKNDLSTSFFSKIQSQKKTACIIADQDTHLNYTKEMLPTTIRRVVKTTPKKIIKHSIKLMDEYNFTVCHINLFPEEKTEELYRTVDNYIRRLYIGCAEKALFVAVASGLGKKTENNAFENALCMVKVKNEKP